MLSPVVETEFLVVGAGPAGAALGCFLGQNGLKGMIISSSPGTANTPRAHITNPFAVECLRDIGLEEQAMAHATTGRPMQAMRWCRSMAGEEYGKALYWAGNPETASDGKMASPCEWIDFPQSDLEPLLVKYAGHHGFPVRFGTELVSVEREEAATPSSSSSSSAAHKILCTLRDTVSQQTYRVRTTYLFGADGARSSVARTFGFAFDSQPSRGAAVNILLNADLGHLMTHPARHAGLHWLMKPDLKTRFGIAPMLRMVRPWKQWLFVAVTQFGGAGAGAGADVDPFRDLTPTSPELLSYLREAIGDDTVDIEVLRLDPWTVREQVATSYVTPQTDVFLLGDAAHRHPPSLGLGSNTCVQDAYNLAWKVAFVTKGLAGRGLLRSYDAERQPVGARVVREANMGIGAHAGVWEALGMFAPSADEGLRQNQELRENTPAGAARREKLHAAIENQAREGKSLGLTMNQWYDSSPDSAVYTLDEPAPRPKLEGDDVVEIQVSTYPGGRLPHAWLEDPLQRREVSTQDLAGHASFALFVGHGGEGWRRAAEEVATATGIPIRVFGIGFGLDLHDTYRQWSERRAVGDDGCVLVRPDRFVAWRSAGLAEDCGGKLVSVLNRVLFREELKIVV